MLHSTIMGIKFSNLSMREFTSQFVEDINNGERFTISLCNPEFLIEAKNNESLVAYLNSCRYTLPDGVGVVIASRILGAPLKERITGTDFVGELAKMSISNGFTLFFLGGEPGVAENAQKSLESRYPGIAVVGTAHGFYQDFSPVINQINCLSPDILMVCLGNPKQEEWIQHNFNRLNVKVAFGNGGALDFAAGKVRRAPNFVQSIGLEWLFRLFQDFSIRRIRRQFRLIKYVYEISKTALLSTAIEN